MGVDQTLHGVGGRVRGGFKGGQTDATAFRVQDAER